MVVRWLVMGSTLPAFVEYNIPHSYQNGTLIRVNASQSDKYRSIFHVFFTYGAPEQNVYTVHGMMGLPRIHGNSRNFREMS